MGNPTDTSTRHRLRRGRTLLVGVVVLGGSLTAAIGGSWMAERKLVKEKAWGKITALTAEAMKIIAQSTKP